MMEVMDMIAQQKAGDDGSVLYDKMTKDEVSVFCFVFAVYVNQFWGVLS